MTTKATFYHRTSDRAAAAILRDGFRDGFHDELDMTGVWVSIHPVGVNEGAKGDALLRVDLVADPAVLARGEVLEIGKPYREWCLPASLMNAGEIRVVSAEEEDGLAPPSEPWRVITTDAGRTYLVHRCGDGPPSPPWFVPGAWYFACRDALGLDEQDRHFDAWLPYPDAEAAEDAARKFDESMSG